MKTHELNDQPTHPPEKPYASGGSFKCVNNDCDQPQAAFSIYCPSCEAIALSNYFTDEITKPERRSETVQVKVKPTEKEALRRMAIREDRSVSDIVRMLIVSVLRSGPATENGLEIAHNPTREAVMQCRPFKDIAMEGSA